MNYITAWILLIAAAAQGDQRPATKPVTPPTPLVAAVQQGKLDVVKQLITAGADVSEPSADGQTPLGAAAAAGNVEAIRFLIASGAHPDFSVPPRFVPLAQAAGAGKVEAMKLLLELEANVQGRNAAGLTPLHTAAAKNQLDAIKLLLAEGAEIDVRTKLYLTPLMSAAFYGKLEAAELLLDSGADATDGSDVYSAVGLAAKAGAWNLVALLLDRGAAVDADMNFEESLTFFAAEQGKADALKDLLRRGAKVKGTQTGLAEAVENGHAHTSAILIEHGARLAEHEFPEALSNAADAGHGEVILMLLRAQRRWNGLPHAPEHDHEDAIVTAAITEDAAAANAALGSLGADRAGVLDAALRVAEKKGHAAVANVIRPVAKQAVAAARERTEKNRALLRECIEPCRTERVAELLAGGAEASAYDAESGFTALYWTSSRGNIEAVKLLLDRSADVNVQRGYRQTPLRGAAGNGHVEVVKLLLSHGADPNLADTGGFTPLGVASFNGKHQVVELLIAAKADVDHARDDGSTALMDAAENGHSNVASALLRAGANPNLRNHAGVTALAIAQGNSKVEVVRVLEKAGATAGDVRPPVSVMTIIARGVGGVRQWLDAGGDPNEVDPGLYQTPLNYVISAPRKMAEDERLAIATLLLERGASAKAPALLKTAIYAGRDVAMLKLLVEHGADVNSGEGWQGGYTPLLIAAEYGTAEHVKYLLDAGAEAGVRLHSGRTAADLVRERRRPDPQVNLLIEQAIAQVQPRPAVR